MLFFRGSLVKIFFTAPSCFTLAIFANLHADPKKKRADAHIHFANALASTNGRAFKFTQVLRIYCKFELLL